jgi:glycosyltransferase involved in cell wall biosynthesis
MSQAAAQRALLISDSDIPTTGLIARELREAFPSLEVRIAPDLFGAVVTGRPVIVSRLCFPRYSWLPDHLSREGVRYAYFIDDNFWEITADIDAGLARFFRHPATVDTLDTFIRYAAVVLTWSKPLRDYVISRFSGIQAEFVTPGFDVAKAAALLQRHQPPTGAADNVVRIGYPTTPRPSVSALIVPVVEHFLRAYGRTVTFEFIGWLPDALADLPNVVFHPWIGDYDKYLEFKISRRWHIGIAPLIGDAFEQYKTNNKYREYGGCMVPGVYSNVSPFRETVDDGKTGMLIENEAGAWIGALEKLVASPVLRSAIAQAAFDDVRRHYDLRTTGRQLADAVLTRTRQIHDR